MTGTRTAWSIPDCSIHGPVPVPRGTGFGGQRQGIGIAQSLAPGPRILVSDWPVSTLDVSVRAQLPDLFQDIQQQRGIACLFVTHDRSVAWNIRVRMAVTHVGRIVDVAETNRIHRAPGIPFHRFGWKRQ